MPKQVEVRLTDGTSEVFDADGWDDDGRGGLVLHDDLGTVASFAPGHWLFVSKILGAPGRVDPTGAR